MSHQKIFFSILSFSLLILFIACTNNQKDKTNGQEKTIADSNTIKPVLNASTTYPYTQIDASPMDMSYFPVDFPKLKMTHKSNISPLARVIYSRPHLGDRRLFHEVLTYNTAWRLGANESTELELFKAATIEDKKIPAGRYVLYCIPQPDTWTIVLNSDLDCWGLKQDTTRDIVKFSVPIKRTNSHLDYFTMLFEKTVFGADLLMAWGDIEARLPIRF